MWTRNGTVRIGLMVARWANIEERTYKRGNRGMGQHETFVKYREWRIIQADRQNKEMTRILKGAKLHNDMGVLARG
jgi:hypothetical protein